MPVGVLGQALFKVYLVDTGDLAILAFHWIDFRKGLQEESVGRVSNAVPVSVQPG